MCHCFYYHHHHLHHSPCVIHPLNCDFDNDSQVSWWQSSWWTAAAPPERWGCLFEPGDVRVDKGKAAGGRTTGKHEHLICIWSVYTQNWGPPQIQDDFDFWGSPMQTFEVNSWNKSRSKTPPNCWLLHVPFLLGTFWGLQPFVFTTVRPHCSSLFATPCFANRNGSFKTVKIRLSLFKGFWQVTSDRGPNSPLFKHKFGPVHELHPAPSRPANSHLSEVEILLSMGPYQF